MGETMEAPVVVAAPSPRSPPMYPDLCGRRRVQLELQILNREIGFIEEEIQSLDGTQHVSRCCKEVNEYVGVKSDPLMPINKWEQKSCYLWRWLRSALCFSVSTIFCCSSGCMLELGRPSCSCQESCRCSCCKCGCPSCCRCSGNVLGCSCSGCSKFPCGCMGECCGSSSSSKDSGSCRTHCGCFRVPCNCSKTHCGCCCDGSWCTTSSCYRTESCCLARHRGWRSSCHSSCWGRPNWWESSWCFPKQYCSSCIFPKPSCARCSCGCVWSCSRCTEG